MNDDRGRHRAALQASPILIAVALATSCVVAQQTGTAPPPPRVQTEQRPTGFQTAILNRWGEGTVLPGLADGWQYHDPALSPDGTRLAFAATPLPAAGAPFPPPLRSHIVVYTLPAGPIVHLEAPGQNTAPSWVGNTGDIAFIRRKSSEDTTRSLIVRRADGTGTERVVLDGEVVALSGSSWFVEGQTFVATHQGTRAAPRGQVLHFDLAMPTEPRRLVNTDFLFSRPALSPDGSMVAFVTATPSIAPGGMVVPGSPRVYVRRLSGGLPVRVSVGTADYPTWSLHGNKLFFMSPTTRVIYSVRRVAGRAFAFESPVQETEGRTGSSSGFAVLAGDSLFVTRTRALMPVSADVTPALRGVRADSATQNVLEIVAATALVPIAREKDVDLATLALETRSYVVVSDPIFAGLAQEIRPYVLPGRHALHLSILGATLGVAGHVIEQPDCPFTEFPRPCRFGSFPGIVDFSPAVVSADSARIHVHAWVGAATPTRVGTLASWKFTLVRRGAEWVVRRVE